MKHLSMSPALAALAICSSSALAQSNVTLYGVIDLGVTVDRGGAAGISPRISSGMATQSRWGLRGTEDLGNGTTAFFAFEGGITADDGAAIKGNVFGRKSIVGLRGTYGEVSIGLQDTPYYSTLNEVVDPFRNGVARSNNLMASTGSRASNSLMYKSKVFHGLTGSVMYAAGEVAQDSSAGRALGASLRYTKGPLNLSLAYHNKDNNTATVKDAGRARNVLAGANYKLGPATVHFGYGMARGPGSAYLTPTTAFASKAPPASTDSRDMLLGLSTPLGPGILLASYVRKDDRGPLNQDAQQFGLGYSYVLSKRTDVYGAIARIVNNNGAAYTAGNSTEPGKGNQQFTLGLRHRF
jgi:predicted porin